MSPARIVLVLVTLAWSWPGCTPGGDTVGPAVYWSSGPPASVANASAEPLDVTSFDSAADVTDDDPADGNGPDDAEDDADVVEAAVNEVPGDQSPVIKELPELCFGPWDCDDDDLCTKDRCVAATNRCEYEAVEGCCHSVADCPIPPACTEVACEEHVCVEAAIFPCCTSDLQCFDGNGCTTDECVALPDFGAECVSTPTPDCCAVLHSNDFQSELSTVLWSVQDVVGDVTWDVMGARFFSPPASLHMGLPQLKGYASVDSKSAATIAMPEVALGPAATAVLRFRMYLDVEPCSPERKGADLLRVFADTDAADNLLLWHKCESGVVQEWTTVHVDLSAMVDRTFTLRFAFDSVDEALNDGEGVYLDDVEVEVCY